MTNKLKNNSFFFLKKKILYLRCFISLEKLLLKTLQIVFLRFTNIVKKLTSKPNTNCLHLNNYDGLVVSRIEIITTQRFEILPELNVELRNIFKYLT